MKEYKYIYHDYEADRQKKFRFYLILTVLYALMIFGLSSMSDPIGYFFR